MSSIIVSALRFVQRFRPRRFETFLNGKKKKTWCRLPFFYFFQTPPLDSPSHNARSRGSPHLQPSFPPTPRPDSVLLCHDPRATQPLMRVHYIPVPDVRAKIAIGSRTFWGGRMGRFCSCSTLRSNMHRGSKGAEGARSTLPDKWLASPCCVPPHRKGHKTGRNVNGHLIATQERIVIRGSTATPTTWQNHRWWDREMGSMGWWIRCEGEKWIELEKEENSREEEKFSTEKDWKEKWWIYKKVFERRMGNWLIFLESS